MLKNEVLVADGVELPAFGGNNNKNNNTRIFQQDNLSIFTNIVIIRVLLALSSQ